MNLLVDLKTIDASGPASGSDLEKSPFRKLCSLFMPFIGRDDLVRVIGFISNAGNPTGTLTPQFIGQLVLDTTNNAFYRAKALTNTDWIVEGAGSIGTSFGAGSTEDNITATPGGTQAAAFALSATKPVHRISVCATGADSVKLPLATGTGNVHVVANDGAASAQLFGAGTDTIDGVATATGVAVANTKRRICVDFAAGKWVSILGA